ncbi:hypothetical protein NDU88_003488 [Pleurodeles waltl]|uniref:Uncharacterized protein n=1 Tax=Pleurodeles waltl TaxID=8319 RepID=A0AAV7KZ43_PLEWA|nr:hypothetical protein NDU88_003488 [Pleurodeles waltl]
MTVGAPGLQLRGDPTRLEDEEDGYRPAGCCGRPRLASPEAAPLRLAVPTRARAAWRWDRAQGREEVVRPCANREIEGRGPDGGRLERRL